MNDKHRLYILGIEALKGYEPSKVKEALYEELHVLGPADFISEMSDEQVAGIVTLMRHTLDNLRHNNPDQT